MDEVPGVALRREEGRGLRRVPVRRDPARLELLRAGRRAGDLLEPEVGEVEPGSLIRNSRTRFNRWGSFFCPPACLECPSYFQYIF